MKGYLVGNQMKGYVGMPADLVLISVASALTIGLLVAFYSNFYLDKEVNR